MVVLFMRFHIDKIDTIIDTIKYQIKVRSLFVSYNIDTKKFSIDDINKKNILSYVGFDVNDFQEFIVELSKLSLWNSDYDFKLDVIKN